MRPSFVPNLIMEKRSDRIRERIERYRQGLPSEETSKKRRFSRTLVIINLLLLIVMIFVFRRPVDRAYHTASVEFDGAIYRLSLMRGGGSDGYRASLSIESGTGAAKTILFSPPVAVLYIMYDSDEINRIEFGESTSRLALHPGETRNFAKRIPASGIEKFAKERPDALVPPRRTIFSRDQFIPLKARLTINTGGRISTTLDFRYEVDR